VAPSTRTAAALTLWITNRTLSLPVIPYPIQTRR